MYHFTFVSSSRIQWVTIHWGQLASKVMSSAKLYSTNLKKVVIYCRQMAALAMMLTITWLMLTVVKLVEKLSHDLMAPSENNLADSRHCPVAKGIYVLKLSFLAPEKLAYWDLKLSGGNNHPNPQLFGGSVHTQSPGPSFLGGWYPSSWAIQLSMPAFWYPCWANKLSRMPVFW